MPYLAPLALWSALALLLAGCQSSPSSDTSPTSADTDIAIIAANPPDWLPLHRNPKPGDYVIHHRLLPDGLTQRQRRTEVTAVNQRHLQVRRTFGDSNGRPQLILQLTVDHQGHVLQASIDTAPDTALPLQPGRRQQTRLRPAEPLNLISGQFPIDHIITRRTDDSGTAVYYLSKRVPFTEVVSLTTHHRYSTAQLIKLLGRIAVPTPGHDTRQKTRNNTAIHHGWVLMHWGRGASE